MVLVWQISWFASVALEVAGCLRSSELLWNWYLKWLRWGPGYCSMGDLAAEQSPAMPTQLPEELSTSATAPITKSSKRSSISYREFDSHQESAYLSVFPPCLYCCNFHRKQLMDYYWRHWIISMCWLCYSLFFGFGSSESSHLRNSWMPFSDAYVVVTFWHLFELLGGYSDCPRWADSPTALKKSGSRHLVFVTHASKSPACILNSCSWCACCSLCCPSGSKRMKCRGRRASGSWSEDASQKFYALSDYYIPWSQPSSWIS